MDSVHFVRRRNAARARPVHWLLEQLGESVRLVLASLAFLSVMALGLALDRGYDLQLLCGLAVLACVLSYRAGVREGEFRRQVRRKNREFEERSRRLRGASPIA